MPAGAEFGFFTPTLAEFFFQLRKQQLHHISAHWFFWSSRYPICDNSFHICFHMFWINKPTTGRAVTGGQSPEACTNLGDAGCTFMAGALSRPIALTVHVRICVCSHVSQCSVGVWGELQWNYSILYSGEIWIVKKTWRTHSWFDLKLRQRWLLILRFLETGPWGEHDDFTPRVDSTGHPLCCPQGAKI